MDNIYLIGLRSITKKQTETYSAKVIKSLFFLCFLIFLNSQPVSAAMMQSRGGITEIPSPQMVLNRVRLESENMDEAVILLEFYPKKPKFLIIRDLNEASNGKKSFSVRFENSRRGPNSADNRFRGLLENLEFSNQNRDIVLNVSTNNFSKIYSEDAGNGKIRLRVTRVSQRAEVNYNDENDNNEWQSQDFQREEHFELIMLKYADVSEVVGLLTQGVSVRPNNTLIRREPGFGSPGSGSNDGNSSDFDEENNDQPLGESVDQNLAINRRLNAIWVRGSLEHIDRVRRQISLIDIPVDSVILETEFVELSEAGSRDIGVDFTNGGGRIAIASARSGEFSQNFDGDGISTGISLQAALYAQVQKGEGRIISKPRISAQSGATAKIITGDALPILTAITLSGVNGVSEQVEYVNVGVTLQIAPRVSPDGFVTSKIYAVVSSVTGNSQGFPTISQREAETSASVRDGESFVIGGLIQDSNIKSDSKVPILGDIPLVGSLFKRKTQTTAKTELYIIITPRIVRHGQKNDNYDIKSIRQ